MANDWKSHLDADENLLWEGAPDRRLFLFRPIDIFLVPFSIFWAGFAVFWEGTAILKGPTAFLLMGLPFVAIGAYILVGRFFVDAHIRRHTSYALTNKRALIARAAFGRSRRDMPITANTPINLNLGTRGTITLGAKISSVANNLGLGIWHGTDENFTFQSLIDADQVYKLIRRIQRGDT